MALLVSNAFAWGKDGHQVVASLAEAQLSAKTHAEVKVQGLTRDYNLRMNPKPPASPASLPPVIDNEYKRQSQGH